MLKDFGKEKEREKGMKRKNRENMDCFPHCPPQPSHGINISRVLIFPRILLLKEWHKTLIVGKYDKESQKRRKRNNEVFHYL